MSRSLTASVKRRRLPGLGGTARRSLDLREHDICKRIATRISEVLGPATANGSEASIKAIRDAFDEYIVAQHVEAHYKLPQLSVGSIFEALHTLSEQSYENKALTFGCILDSQKTASGQGAHFPGSS